MAFRVVPNFYSATDGGHIHKLKEELVADGWDVVASGTGSGGAYGHAGALPADRHSPGVAYAGTLDLQQSWFRLRAPATMSPRRELLFYRPSTSYSVWRVAYSSDGTGFTGGTPSATAVPTAADEQYVINTSSGSSAWWAGGTGMHKMDLVIGDLSEEFSFFMGMREVGEAIYRGGMGLDVLHNAHVSDADPCVFLRLFATTTSKSTTSEYFRETNTSFFTSQAFSGTSGMGGGGWYKKGLTGATYVTYVPNLLGLGNGSGTSPMGDTLMIAQDASGMSPRWPNVIYSRGPSFSTQKGFKGRSRLLKNEVLTKVGIALYGDKSRIVAGAFSLPWDGLTDLVL